MILMNMTEVHGIKAREENECFCMDATPDKKTLYSHSLYFVQGVTVVIGPRMFQIYPHFPPSHGSGAGPNVMAFTNNGLNRS